MDSANARRQVSLSQRDQDQWLQIQKNTFTNWINECLRSRSIVVEDVRTDFADGVNLVALVESLARRNITGAVSRPSNQYEKLQNITIALDTVSRDGVKMVNIDSSDIMACNLKLVLALVWQLILKYQVGLSASQHRAWIFKWLRAVIPECSVTNLTTDWNDGILLHALLDFCQPGVSSNWRSLPRDDRVENCRSAMKLARQHFNIPLILRPEDLASAQLDERSFITYLSYFIRVGGPAYDATLERVASRTKPKTVTNFTTDWQDGQALTHLVRSAGGRVADPDDNGYNALAQLTKAIESASLIGVEPMLTASEMNDESSEHLGIMSYSAQFLRFSNHTITAITNLNSTNEHISVSSSNINLLSTTNGNNDIHVIGATTAIVDVRQPLQVTTEYHNDNSSSHTSVILSPRPRLSQPEYELVTKHKASHQNRRVELPPPEQLKVDVYSVGVIMESKITGSFDPEKFKVEAKSPCGRVIRMSGNGHYAAQFSVTEIGRWDVSMTYDGHYMDGCPIDVCDPSQVTIKDMRGGVAGRPNTFLVDCSRAGNGDVGVDVTHYGRTVSSYLTKTNTPGVFKAFYTPYTKGPYEVNVHFNRAEIREADFHSTDLEDRQRRAIFNTEVEPKNGYVEVKCTCDWKIDYMTGGPFVCHVSDGDDIPVYAMTDGTVCGRPELIVDCTNFGDGPIEAEATYQGRSFPCKVKRDKEKPLTYRVRFKPRGPGTYKIWITYEGRSIKGCPFTQHIAELEGPTAHGDGLYRGVPGKPATFVIDTKNTVGQVAVSVTGPSQPVSSKVEPRDNNTILATYHPIERGPHRITVKMDGKDIKGSPFRPLIVDPVKVRVSGGWRPLLDDAGVIPLNVNKEKVLPFDVSDAGPGELTSEVQGPNGKIPVTIDARNDGKHSVIFTPREEGKHYIHVNWGGYPLSSSPYLGNATQAPVEDQVDSFPNVRLVQVPLQSPVYMHPVNNHLHSPDSSVGPSSVDGPLVSVRRGSDPDSHRPNGIVYMPNEPTRIRVIPAKQPPPPEPHIVYSRPEPHFIYSPPPEPERPTVIRYQQPQSPTILYQQQPQSPKVIYQQPQSPTIYYQNNDYPVLSPRPQSPPSRTSSARAPQKVVLSGKGLKEAEVDKPAEFQVDGTRADPGSPTPHLESIRHTVPVKTEPVRPNVYRCKYTPEHPGAYLLYVNWNGKPLRGSPFKVNVRDRPRPERVAVTFDPPQNATIGKDYELKVDPREAGPEGAARCIKRAVQKTFSAYLALYAKAICNAFLMQTPHCSIVGLCKGSQLTIRCTDPLGRVMPHRTNDNVDGTKGVKMTPTMPGRHIVEVRSDGQHVRGSPFAVDISASQPKGSVKCWGPGIEDGVIPHFKSTFWVETTGAGAGDLRVRIMGPKGAFHVKMRKASQKDKIYQCFYDPVEPGVYTVHVQWSGVHVEGSPFTVLIGTSEQEVAQMKGELKDDDEISDIMKGRRSSLLY